MAKSIITAFFARDCVMVKWILWDPEDLDAAPVQCQMWDSERAGDAINEMRVYVQRAQQWQFEPSRFS
jgi:hypothetical protein